MAEKTPQGIEILHLSEAFERLVLNLANPLSGEVEFLGNVFQGHGVFHANPKKIAKRLLLAGG